jgi:hypothetical protein
MLACFAITDAPTRFRSSGRINSKTRFPEGSFKMHRIVHGVGWLGSGLLLLSGVLGCQRAEDPAVLAQRQKYVLPSRPQEAVDVTDARRAVEAEPGPLVLVARVGAIVDATWEPGKAAFVVRDVNTPGGARHDFDPGHDNCPFCQAKRESSNHLTALVRFVDDSGEVVAIDARELLAIREDQLIVVRGAGQIDDLGNLVVMADGIYVQR